MPVAHLLVQIPNPTPSNDFPGGDIALEALGWLKWLGLAGSLAAFFIGGAVWGLSQAGGNSFAASRGRSYALGVNKWVTGGAAAIGIFATIFAIVAAAGGGAGTAGTGETPSIPGAGTLAVVAISDVAATGAPVPAADPSEAAHEAVGTARAQPDALDAAIGFLELAEHVVRLPPDDAARLQRAISTPSAADRLAAETEARVAALQQSAPEGVHLWVAPLAVETEQHEAGGAVVRVWSVRTIALGQTHVTTQWVTTSYVLERRGGEWFIDDIDSEPGPVPEPGIDLPWDPVELLAKVGGWDSVS